MSDQHETSATLPDRPLITMAKTMDGIEITSRGMSKDLERIELNELFIPVEMAEEFLLALSNLINS